MLTPQKDDPRAELTQATKRNKQPEPRIDNAITGQTQQKFTLVELERQHDQQTKTADRMNDETLRPNRTQKTKFHRQQKPTQAERINSTTRTAQ